MEEIVITVYPNRHMRANRPELNDVQRSYISRRALRALHRAGLKLKFLKVVKSFEDVTASFLGTISKPEFAERKTPVTPGRKKEYDFDPYDRKRA